MNYSLILLLYTDPGMGAMIWQLSAASIVGALFYFRHYIAKLKGLVISIKNRRSQSKIA